MKTWGFAAIFFMAALFSTDVHANSSLQELVNQTPVNGVITLENKTYEGNLVITKPVTLKGSGSTVIKGDGTGNVIVVKAPGVHLENLTVKNSSFNRNTAEEFAAIKVHTDHNVLKNIVITDSYHGVYLSQAHHNEVSDIQVTGKSVEEIAGQGNGIMVYYSNKNKLSDITIKYTRDGIYFEKADDNVVTNAHISYTRYGLHYMYSDRGHMTNNSFVANTAGAALMHSQNLVLTNNLIALQQGTRAFGVMLQSCDDSIIQDNDFYQNQRALYIDQSSGNRIEGNRILQNQVGIELWASSMDHVFTKNFIDKNTAPVIMIGGQARNQWNENGIGNDWGTGFPLMDLDQNGIGDHSVQYKSSLNKLIEENELVYLFLKSPAIGIYELIGKFLHNQNVMVEDQFPLVTKQESNPLPWVTGFTLLLVGYVYMKGRRKSQ